jgi:hypothetical protein
MPLVCVQLYSADAKGGQAQAAKTNAPDVEDRKHASGDGRGSKLNKIGPGSRTM